MQQVLVELRQVLVGRAGVAIERGLHKWVADAALDARASVGCDERNLALEQTEVFGRCAQRRQIVLVEALGNVVRLTGELQKIHACLRGHESHHGRFFITVTAESGQLSTGGKTASGLHQCVVVVLSAMLICRVREARACA